MLNKLKHLLLISTLSITITACSWTDFVKLLSPSSGGVEAELVVGDKKEEISTEIGTQTQTAQEITNTTVENAPVWLILFGVAGWVLPSPQSMWKAWRARRVK